MIPCLHANEIWMTAMEQPAAPRWQTGCPECRRDMTAVLIPYQGREVELEICRGCQRLWLDNQEVMSNRISISDRAPGRKPPVIRMTGRGAAVMVREQARRIRDRINYESTGLTRWHLLLILVLIVARILISRR